MSHSRGVVPLTERFDPFWAAPIDTHCRALIGMGEQLAGMCKSLGVTRAFRAQVMLCELGFYLRF
uniref:Uncharacterized protein n=1 Tax=mine drainage metagenome TaxID=410659 RepID=E6PP44_9ZZZZ